MNGKNGLFADFVATFNFVRLHAARALCAFTSYFDILRFPVRYSAVLFRFMPFRVNGYPEGGTTFMRTRTESAGRMMYCTQDVGSAAEKADATLLRISGYQVTQDPGNVRCLIETTIDERIEHLGPLTPTPL